MPSARALGFLYGSAAGRGLANVLITKPWFSRLASIPSASGASTKRIGPFAEAHGIDLAECGPSDWPSFAAFFARRPREGARPIDPCPAHLIAPADSKLTAHRVRRGLAVEIKGVRYSLGDLTGHRLPVARFEGGWCLVFRLSVDDFHHYVYQDAGRTRSRRWIRGRLETVGPASAGVPVLARNQRLVSVLDTENLGLTCVIAVGALTVGKIVDCGAARFERGEEQGRFELGGSTLVVLLEPGRVEIDPDILELTRGGAEVKVALGSRIGLITASRSHEPDARRPEPTEGRARPRTAEGGPGAHPDTSPDRPRVRAEKNSPGPAAQSAVGPGLVNGLGGAAGPKAAGLARLAAAGLPVPEFAAVPVAAMREAITPFWEEIAQAIALPDPAQAAAAAGVALADARLSASLEDAIRGYVQPGVRYAVRSSAVAEDGTERSAAGCYLTLLDVPADQVGPVVMEVWRSAFTPAALAYARAVGRVGLVGSLLGVVIQPMVEAAVSGVVFTANPAGPLNEAAVTAGHGTGAGVDDGAELATYLVHRPQGSASPRAEGAREPSTSAAAAAGADWLVSCHNPAGGPQLTRDQLVELLGLAEAAEVELGGPVDVEFALGHQGQFWLLQARPITTLGAGRGVILDNSNIVESYPGLSRALTASFAGDIYHRVFRSLAERLGSRSVARERDGDLAAMVAWWGGRMYYQISNWYALLTLLPFQRVVVNAWQDMLGVRQREFNAGQSLPWPGRLRVWASLARSGAKAPALVDILHQHFEEVEREFWRRLGSATGANANPLAAAGAPESGSGLQAEPASALYRWLARELASKWDVTLINDAYTFAFTAALTALAKRARVDRPAEAAARLITQGRPLVSLEPLAARQALTRTVRADHELAAFLQELDSDQAVRAWLAVGRPHPDLAQRVARFIDWYGDRATEELKLETATARSHPLTLIRTLLSDAATTEAGGLGDRADGIVQTDETPGGRGEGGLDAARGMRAEEAFPRRYRRLARWLARRARAGVAARELSRLDRSRLFGMVRELFRLRGADLAHAGALADAEDVTHLTIAEALMAGGPPEARELVRRRRERLAAYGRLPAYPRVAFAGPLVERSPLAGWAEGDGAAARREAGSLLRGEGCSSGTAEAAVLVVRGPLAPGAGAGRILVTEATDPGWVFHLAMAAGVVSEKGSLLSHTAIVARELGVPFVAGVAGATNLLANLDQVRIDGAAGTVELLACCPAGPGGEDTADGAVGEDAGGDACLSREASVSDKADGAGRGDAGGEARGHDGTKAPGGANGGMGVQP